MLILYIAIIVTFGLSCLPFIEILIPRTNRWLARSGVCCGDSSVIAWYALCLLTTVRHAAARQDRVSRVTSRSMPLPHRAHQQLPERLESNRGPFRGRSAKNACFGRKLAIVAEGVSAQEPRNIPICEAVSEMPAFLSTNRTTSRGGIMPQRCGVGPVTTARAVKAATTQGIADTRPDCRRPRASGREASKFEAPLCC
jgi:hypothetical protein